MSSKMLCVYSQLTFSYQHPDPHHHCRHHHHHTTLPVSPPPYIYAQRLVAWLLLYNAKPTTTITSGRNTIHQVTSEKSDTQLMAYNTL